MAALNIDPQEFWAQVFAKEDELVSRGLVWDTDNLERNARGQWEDSSHKAHVFITSIPNAKLERLRQHASGRTMPWELRIAAMALCEDTPLHRVSEPGEIAAYKLDCDARTRQSLEAEAQRKGNSSAKEMQGIIAIALETAMREGNANVASAVEAAVKAVLAARDEVKPSVRGRNRKESEAPIEELEREEVSV